MQWAVVGFPCGGARRRRRHGPTTSTPTWYTRRRFCDRDGAEERWDRQGAAQGAPESSTSPEGRELRIVAPGHRSHPAGRRADVGGARRPSPNIPGRRGVHRAARCSAEGVVTFPFPAHHAGRRIDGVRLVFERGVVVEAHADDGQDVLDAALAIDAGARRLGEVGIGTNYALPRFTGRTLLDEKIGGMVHFALGSSYPETGGTNVSACTGTWSATCAAAANCCSTAAPSSVTASSSRSSVSTCDVPARQPRVRDGRADAGDGDRQQHARLVLRRRPPLRRRRSGGARPRAARRRR